MPHESAPKTLAIALIICLVCSVLVSTAVITLRGMQDRNREMDKLKNVLAAGGILQAGKQDIQSLYRERIRTELIDLRQGIALPESLWNADLDPDHFDIKTIARHPLHSRPIPPELDIARIGRMPIVMAIYEVMDHDSVSRYILPVYGKGLWSTMYGLLAISGDLVHIEAFTFYEHGETPGLGGEVDNPRWKKLWKGKQVYDEQGHVLIRVVKGSVDPLSPQAAWSVDGLSGSTLTTRGVDRTIRFWLGEQGYGPFLRHLQQ